MTEISDERKAEIVKEFQTLRAQSQDEQSIIRALCAKYSIDPHELGQMMQENLKGEGQPARPGQMGESPPKGTIQGSKAPKGQADD